MANPSPQLVISQQDSLAKLLLTTKTGAPRDVHVVVKNTPFNVVLGIVNNLPGSERIDLSKSTVSVDVHYDSDEPQQGKQVKLMNSKPCEYKVHLSDKRSDEATLEVRMKVLTSQHEDMLFRLHISVTNGSSRILRTTTCAMKVVSKPDQVRRINGEKGKKRTHSDVVNESLERIEKRQQQQQALLMKILKSNTTNNNPPVGNDLRLSSSTSSFEDQQTSPAPIPSSIQHLQHLVPNPHQQPQPTDNKTTIAFNPKPDDMSFEAAFALCMKKYAALPQSERPAKMRKIVSTSNSRDTRSISEFSDALRTEGLGALPSQMKPHRPVTASPVAPPPVAPVASSFSLNGPPQEAPKMEPQQQQYHPMQHQPQQQQHQPQQQQQQSYQQQPQQQQQQQQQPTDNFAAEFSSLSNSLSFSDVSLSGSLNGDFIQEMFQNTLSPFHF